MRSQIEQRAVFIEPEQPTNTFFSHHEHEWTAHGRLQNPNGTWSSLWECAQCPDIGIGGYVGEVPAGFCPACHWVQKKWPRKRCEECKTVLTTGATS